MSSTNNQGQQKTVLVTGATSGIGFEAAAQLATSGYSEVIITGRTLERAEAARAALAERTGLDVFRPLAVDLGNARSIDAAVASLAGSSIGALVLNAGMGSTAVREFTDDNVELIVASSLIGHHRLTIELLENSGLAADARIVISGSETARGDVATMDPAQLGEIATNVYGGDLVAAAAGLIRGDVPKKFNSRNTYATAKLFVAWWAAELARRLPAGMVVNAVSPGSTPGTEGARNAGFFTRRVMMPMLTLAPARMLVASSVDVSASRYLEALDFSSDINGEFYASAPKKLAGPLERMVFAHINNRAHQTAAWAAIADISGLDLEAKSAPAP